jgi:hypothetical protein
MLALHMAKEKNEKQKRTNSLKGKPRVITPAILENPGGRPSEFNDAAPKIINYIRNGNTYECACACARISYSTFASWIRQGKQDLEDGLLDSKFLKFMKDIEQAEMEAEQEAVQAWRSFIPVSWQAARDFLARKNPDKWGSKDKMDVTSNGETLNGHVIVMKEQEPLDESED